MPDYQPMTHEELKTGRTGSLAGLPSFNEPEPNPNKSGRPYTRGVVIGIKWDGKEEEEEAVAQESESEYCPAEKEVLEPYPMDGYGKGS